MILGGDDLAHVFDLKLCNKFAGRSFVLQRISLRLRGLVLAILGKHVDGELDEVGVKLAGELEADGDTGHGDGDEVVEVVVGGVGQIKCVVSIGSLMEVGAMAPVGVAEAAAYWRKLGVIFEA